MFTSILAVLFLFSLADSKMVFENFVSFSEKELANFSAVITRNSEGLSVMNMTIDLADVVTKMVVDFTFSAPADKNDKNYQKVIMKTNINVCKMLNGVMGNFLTKMIMEDFHKFADFDLKCPSRKGTLRLLNFAFNDKYLPTFVLTEDFKYCLLARVTGKMARTKGLVHLFTVKTYGEILKD